VTPIFGVSRDKKQLLLYSLPWRERVRVRGIVSSFTGSSSYVEVEIKEQM